MLGTVAAGGVFGFFSATTQNAGNEISTGTVALTDNDGGSAQFNVKNAKPGDSWTRCIKVSYAGTLPADVHHYLQATQSPIALYLHLKLEEGTQTPAVFPDCTGFTSATTLFDAGVPAYPGKNFENGSVTSPAGQLFWLPGDSVVFRTTLTLSDAAPDTVQGITGGNLTVVWEARNH